MQRLFFYISFICLVSGGCKRAPTRNHLSSASSPYLQEHADNPVDWYEWSDEALDKAKKENKPVIISIGYASCHWCHVMEKESFMDTTVARIMNENFICIKVDREERPDIDNIYMNACQLISGSGGWPLNAFALPNGKPFFAGTYYSKTSWIALLNEISKAYREKHSVVIQQADALTRGIADQELNFLKQDSSYVIANKISYNNLFDTIYKHWDLRNGGLKGAPKFPTPSAIEYLLQYNYLTGNRSALDAATLTLTRMASGGIYDQLGGGFARYATDTAWRIPHFEKMLYDNGQLVSAYAHAYQITRNENFRRIIEETISFVERELQSPEHAFYSSLNADSEEGEGEYYIWNYDEFTRIAGTAGPALANYYNVFPEGNWNNSRNILFVEPDSSRQLPKDLVDAKNKVFQYRNKRKKPTTDTKILTSWNAIMLRGYADAYAATGNSEYYDKAIATSKFLEKNMLDEQGHLWRNYKDNKATIDGFLEDYAWVAKAFIRLYQVSFDKHWLDQAKLVTEYADSHFYDGQTGFYFYTEESAPGLVARKMEIADNVIPSSNSIMAEVLYDLGVYFENAAFSEKSRLMYIRIAGKIGPMASYYSQWCSLAGRFAYGTYEVAIMGKDAGKKRQEIQQEYLPDCIMMGSKDKEDLPLLENKLSAGKTLIYVCTNRTCKMPVEDVNKAIGQIRKH